MSNEKINLYLTNGKYDPNKSESRKAQLHSTTAKSCSSNSLELFDRGFNNIKAIINKKVRAVDAKIEELKEIASHDVYIREKVKWNNGFSPRKH